MIIQKGGNTHIMIENVGLVLEGGGMRGVYTAGVLECFLENNIHFPYVTGVSAGASYAASYISQQKGRNKKVSLDFIQDPRYMSWSNFRRTGQFFGMDFIYREIPTSIVPFDFKTFLENQTELKIGTTDIETGKSIFYKKEDYKQEILEVLTASSSLPFLAPIVTFRGRQLLDGGISNPIPVHMAREDGYEKNVVVLTRNKGYRKKKSKLAYFLKRKYPEYKGLHKAMAERAELYNRTIEWIESEEEKGNIIIIRPEEKLKVGRLGRDPIELKALFEQGYKDAEKSISNMKEQSFL